MVYLLNLEEMEGRWIAHVPALPGCFASAETRELAVAAAPRAIADHRAWLRAHGAALPEAPTEVEVNEVHRAWLATPDNEINAFFAADRPPLTADEIARALRLLEWTRADLLAAVEGLSPDDLDRQVEDGWSIARVLKHVGGAEWWYLEKLGLAFPREAVPEAPLARLERVRAQLRSVLPALAGDDRLTEPTHEHWSARKVLRRALWHERDHTAHILRFRQRLAA
jgi:predicted RNase H-like HicB family nuclease